MSGSFDGYSLEGVFQRVKLNCSQLDDPSVQLALVLHDPQMANEVFLLSLRDCVVTMPSTHPLKKWLQTKTSPKSSESSRKIQERLEGELKGIWSSDHALTPKERQALIRFLDDLEDLPPYLDFFVLRAVGYLKLGNWARTEKMLVDWLNEDLLERIARTPKRFDPLGKFTTGMAPVLFNTLAEGLEGHAVVDMFFQGIREFYDEKSIVSEAESQQVLDESELIAKFSLRYYQAMLPGFSAWVLNREWEGKRRQRFLTKFFEQKTNSDNLWVFLGRIPEDAKNRESLAQALAQQKTAQPILFHSLAQDQSLLGVLTRVAPDQMRNLIKERRSLLQSKFREKTKDAWVLKGLVELGQIDPSMIQVLATP